MRYDSFLLRGVKKHVTFIKKSFRFCNTNGIIEPFHIRYNLFIQCQVLPFYASSFTPEEERDVEAALEELAVEKLAEVC